MEVARADLLRTLGLLPCARETLLGLAEEVRTGKAPAAELLPYNSATSTSSAGR